MQYQPPEDLKRFLAAGSRPVYVGFGSMTLSKAKVPSQACLAGLPAIPVMSCIGFTPASIAHLEQHSALQDLMPAIARRQLQADFLREGSHLCCGMQEVTETVLRAVQQAGVRAILLEGPATLAYLALASILFWQPSSHQCIPCDLH